MARLGSGLTQEVESKEGIARTVFGFLIFYAFSGVPFSHISYDNIINVFGWLCKIG